MISYQYVNTSKKNKQNKKLRTKKNIPRHLIGSTFIYRLIPKLVPMATELKLATNSRGDLQSVRTNPLC